MESRSGSHLAISHPDSFLEELDEETQTNLRILFTTTDPYFVRLWFNVPTATFEQYEQNTLFPLSNFVERDLPVLHQYLGQGGKNLLDFE